MAAVIDAGPCRLLMRASGLVLLAGVSALAGDLPAVAPTVPALGPPGSLPVELEYHAHKLVFSTVTKARLELLPVTAVSETLRPAPSGEPLPLPPETVASFTIESSLPFGRHEIVRVLLDPRSGAALQSDKLTTGRKAGRVVSRFLTEGVYAWRSVPADKGEEKLAPEAWTKRRETFSPYPPELPADAVVTEAYALIPLAAAARLDRGDSALKLCVPSRDGFLALDLSPAGFEQRRVKVEELRSSGRSLRAGLQVVKLVRVSARAVPATGKETAADLAVLGFQGGVTLLIDTTTGLPLGMMGRADYVGAVTAMLTLVRYEGGSSDR
jgi:hypothetical protein